MRVTRGRHVATGGDPDAALVRRAGRRIGLQAAGLVSVIVIILTATATGVVLHNQQVGASALLEQANARAIDVLDPPNGVFLIARTADGRMVSTPGLPPGLADEPALRRTAATGVPEAFDLHLDHRSYTAQTIRRGDGVTLEAILDLSANHRERNRLVSAMLMSGVLGLLLAAAAGVWLGLRATRPLGVALALQHRFISDASHELRTPLTLLSTRAQLLRRQLRAAGCAAGLDDAATRVVTDAQRLAAILDDLLLAANPGAEQKPARIDVLQLAADIVAECQLSATDGVIVTGPTAGAHGTNQPAREQVVVVGSPIALRRAITALIDNATRHARAVVRISARRLGRQVVVDVADDGPGVDPGLADRLFQRFATRAPNGDGRRHYGLGLALVGEIVAAHNGTVDLVESGPSGSMFRITLPAAGPKSAGHLARHDAQSDAGKEVSGTHSDGESRR
jgi:signal transduction histidine kinase